MRTSGLRGNELPSRVCLVLISTVFLAMLAASPVAAQTPNKSSEPGTDYSGMYSFLQEGEFLQLTVEDQGQVTGFISRYSDAQHQGFADHFFKQARLQGHTLSFSTEIIQNISYDFKGSVERGEGKKPGDEAYYMLKGTLTQNTMDVTHKTISKSESVVFKLFPDDSGVSK